MCHRDLKVENILYQGDTIKIGDFGSCTREFHIDYKNADRRQVLDFLSDIESQSTRMYRAPELVCRYCSEYADEQCDVWSLGCIFYVMCSGSSHPF